MGNVLHTRNAQTMKKKMSKMQSFYGQLFKVGIGEYATFSVAYKDAAHSPSTNEHFFKDEIYDFSRGARDNFNNAQNILHSISMRNMTFLGVFMSHSSHLNH